MRDLKDKTWLYFLCPLCNFKVAFPFHTKNEKATNKNAFNMLILLKATIKVEPINKLFAEFCFNNPFSLGKNNLLS